MSAGFLPAPTISWIGGLDGHARVLDQTLLPIETRVLEVTTVEAMREAIHRLAVRGAPAIGVAGAFGVALGSKEASRESPSRFLEELRISAQRIASARPTAVNLEWGVRRALRAAEAGFPAGVSSMRTAVLAEALKVLEEDISICARLGEVGAPLVSEGDVVLTHCNAGALATAGLGTALAVLYQAKNSGKRFQVYADETRPLLQGARLTTYELQRAGIPVTLICDNAAAHTMKCRGVTKVFVGADRIARNGDTANKIGTYGVALLAKAHGIPFYVVAPRSTFDLTLLSGDQIPIEERAAEEVTLGFGARTAPESTRVFSPAFDVTPASLITGIVTEHGLITPVTTERITALLKD